MSEKYHGVYLEEEVAKEFKILATREGKKIKQLHKDIILEYVKTHKEGNPQHLIQQWLENEDFTGLPAMGISLDNKKSYTAKHLIKEQRLTDLGQQAWGHVCEWYTILKKG